MCFFQTGLIPGDWQRLSKHPRPLKQHQGKIIVTQLLSLHCALDIGEETTFSSFLNIHYTYIAQVVPQLCVCDLCNTQCVY